MSWFSRCSWCGGPFNGGNCRHCTNVSFGNEPVYDSNPNSYNQTPDISNPHSQPLTSSFNQFHCFHCKDPLEDGVRCQRCTCVRCGHYLGDGFCSFCNSEAGNSFVNDSNPNSFNDPPNVFTHPPQPQYETYSCELCGNDSHHGYDCPPRFPLFLQRQQAANIDQSPPRKISLQEMEDLKQHYLDEMLSLSNDLGIKDYRNEKIDIRFRRECEDMIDEYSSTYGDMSVNQIDVIDVACEEYAQELLNNDPSSPFPLSHNPLRSSTTFSSSSLTPVETSDVLLEEFADELALLEPFLPGIGDDEFDSEGNIFLLEKFLNDDPSSPLPPKEFNFEKLKMIKSSIDDFSSVNVYEEKSVTFSNPLFDSNDDFTSSDDESLFDEDVPEDNVKIYSNPLFAYDDEYISSDVNPLFDEVLEDIESKDSYVSNLDEPALLVTPLSDANEDECFDPGGVIDEIDAFLDMDISTDIENGDHDSEGDIIYLESLLIDDTIPNLPPGVFLDHDPRSLKDEPDNDDLMTKDKVFNLRIWEIIFSPTYVKLSFEDRHYFSFTYVIRIFLPYFTYPMDSFLPLSFGSEDTIFDPGISAFHFSSLEPVAFESQMEVCSSTCSIPMDN
ncbi:hypothetical protein Tco_0916398 [Tanacetum coccineum]